MIEIVGTAKFHPVWLDQNVKEINDTHPKFNKLFWSFDSFNILILKCINNVIVFLVTTVDNVTDEKKIP